LMVVIDLTDSNKTPNVIIIEKHEQTGFRRKVVQSKEKQLRLYVKVLK